MDCISLLFIVKNAVSTVGMAKFLSHSRVNQTKKRVSDPNFKNYLDSQFSGINTKIDAMIASPLKSALTYMEMAKSASGQSCDNYMHQALFKLVEASSYIDEDSDEWHTVFNAMAMCQYYTGDYINAIKSLDKSMLGLMPNRREAMTKYPDEYLFSDMPVRRQFIKYYRRVSLDASEVDYIKSTFNLMAELWYKANNGIFYDGSSLDFIALVPISSELNLWSSQLFYNCVADIFNDYYDLSCHWLHVKNMRLNNMVSCTDKPYINFTSL